MENEKTVVNSVIDELAKINRAAEGYAESSEEAKKQLEKDFRKRKEDFDLELSDAQKERIEALREKLTAENNAKIDKIHADSETYLNELENSFAANHSKWAEEIAEQIMNER